MIKRNNINLTEGNILKGLITMALPIIGTSFIQMTYSLTDMFWIGFLGSDAVTAIGIAGFFVWLSNAFVMLSKTGTEIRVAQATGANDDIKARDYAQSGIIWIFIIGIFYSLVLFTFRNPLILFFNTGDQAINTMAENYLIIISLGMIFPFANQVFTGIFNGRGDSKTPFIANTIGLAINMILDPLFIHIFNFGVKGAAIATILAQLIVFLIFIYKIRFQDSLFDNFKLFIKPKVRIIKDIVNLGYPMAMHSGFFTFISILITRIVSQYGSTPIGVQKIGSQIESLTWMTALGISVAFGAFVGQNYGAQKYDRLIKGYKLALKLALAIGIFTTLLLFFGAEFIFKIFLREEEAVILGTDYLRILAISQIFMCIEITISGAFNGIGLTKPPAIISIVFNFLRIPMALFFTTYTSLGLNGIWLSISISSIFKGSLAYFWFRHILKHKKEFTQY